MSLTLKINEPHASVYVDLNEIFDQEGPASLATPEVGPNWTSSDETVATVSPTADHFTAEVKAVSPGSAKIAAVFDLDDGRTVVATGNVTVEHGDNVVKSKLKFIEGAQGAPPSKQD